MPVEENIALMKRWFKEVWNEGRVQTIYELMDANAIGIGQDPNGVIHGPAGFESLFSRMRGAFPLSLIHIFRGSPANFLDCLLYTSRCV